MYFSHSDPHLLFYFFFGWFFCFVFYFPVLFLHLKWVAQSTEKFLVTTKVNLVIDLSTDLQKMLLCKSFILVTSYASCFYLVGQRDAKCLPTRTQYWWSVIRLSNWEDLCVCVCGVLSCCSVVLKPCGNTQSNMLSVIFLPWKVVTVMFYK